MCETAFTYELVDALAAVASTAHGAAMLQCQPAWACPGHINACEGGSRRAPAIRKFVVRKKLAALAAATRRRHLPFWRKRRIANPDWVVTVKPTPRDARRLLSGHIQNTGKSPKSHYRVSVAVDGKGTGLVCWNIMIGYILTEDVAHVVSRAMN
ncbi:unnamed protein product [Symbiodinium microadriaticum]|nr:unnamed protein product [Symbiodinium microadriaticum]